MNGDHDGPQIRYKNGIANQTALSCLEISRFFVHLYAFSCFHVRGVT